MLHCSWGLDAKWLCNPVLTCHSCPLSWFACPIGVFVHYAAYWAFPFLAVGTVLALGVVFGRLLCGWVCPFGFIQDLLYKIPGRKYILPNWTGYIKYAVLVLFVLLLPALFGESTVFSFCRYCPASAIEVTLPNVASAGIAGLDAGSWIKLGVLAVVLLLAMASSRSFCKVFCPIGAILGPLNLVSFWTVKPIAKCQECHRCDKYCPANGIPSKHMAQGVPPSRALECIVCHDCQKACPHKDSENATG